MDVYLGNIQKIAAARPPPIGGVSDELWDTVPCPEPMPRQKFDVADESPRRRFLWLLD
jgi:hypothetical protein